MGKGSAPRPFEISSEEYASRWDAIFGRDKPKAEAPAPEESSAPQDDDGGTCPVCRSDLVYRNVKTRSTDELTYTAGRMVCPECGYKGDLMEDVA